MEAYSKGRYSVRLAQSDADLIAAQSLRHRAFFGAPGVDADEYDPLCEHILVERATDQHLVCCFRLMLLGSGDDLTQSYSAQYYDLAGLADYTSPMIEMGRFCIDPDITDPDVVRIAWGAMTDIVERTGTQMLFGCASFEGVQADTYRDAFGILHEKHLAPKRWLPKVKAPKVVRFAQIFRRATSQKPDHKRAMLRMPPLLRTYLLMGGWVSDHAVVDTKMNTLHVFTGLEISAIPQARQRFLRLSAS
ncbi:MAG: GNAT family N-acyltransferase [Pseudomonadota bacterium]